MPIKYDPRFIETNIELSALRDYYEMVKQSSILLNRKEKELLENYRLSANCTPDDFEWHFSLDNYEWKTEFFLPRYLWGPFLVTLYAVMEATILEAIKMIDDTRWQQDKWKGDDLLSRSNSFFVETINHSLMNDNELWIRLKLLAALRHTIAHYNGRYENMNGKIKKKIDKAIIQDIGVSNLKGFVVVNGEFANACLIYVIRLTMNLIEACKQWDDNRKA